MEEGQRRAAEVLAHAVEQAKAYEAKFKRVEPVDCVRPPPRSFHQINMKTFVSFSQHQGQSSRTWNRIEHSRMGKEVRMRCRRRKWKAMQGWVDVGDLKVKIGEGRGSSGYTVGRCRPSSVVFDKVVRNAIFGEEAKFLLICQQPV